MLGRLNLVSPPEDLPVYFEDLRSYVRVETDDEDDLLQELAEAAVDHVEAMTGRALMAQDWRLTLDRFADAMAIEKSPLIAVTSIGYRDAAGDMQELDAASYVLDLVSDPPRIVRADGATWPGLISAPGVITVEFTAGYTDVDMVPSRIKLAIKQCVAHWFENRTPGPVPDSVDGLLDRRVML